MNINWPKLLTVDFALGKVISLRKAFADSVSLLIESRAVNLCLDAGLKEIFAV
jgi:hypothetical protein